MLSTFSIVTALAASAAAETVHNVLIFTRHGDRTSKYYPTAVLTDLGATQMYASGDFYRQRYLSNTSSSMIAGVSTDKLVPAQLYATAPDSAVLYQTTIDFLQGFYPPLGGINPTLAVEKLTNGSNSEAPLNDYQFVQTHVKSANDPDTFWLQGDVNCPAFTTASADYRKSPEYLGLINSTSSFYSQFESILNPIMGAGNVSYKNAYMVFDLLNTASIHNASVSSQIDQTALTQARYYANEWESGMNFNASEPMRSIGGSTLAGIVLQQLNASVVTNATKQKFTLMAGSYDTFLSFFGLTNLTSTDPTFLGIPNYAGNMVFELFSAGDNDSFPTNVNDDLQVRWMFRNGSDASNNLTTYPLFGSGQQSLSYGDFTNKMGGIAVKSLKQWCGMCGSTQAYCVAANGTAASTSQGGAGQTSSMGGSKLSDAAAGGIGAAVTLAVVAILGGLAFLLVRKRSSKPATAPARHAAEKKSGSETDSV